MTEPKERIDRSGVDIVLLKTFLELARTRHFGKTADLLFITQSAVSARIKLLESTLGVALFTRRRHDIQLTPAGRRLQPHAETIARSWSQARTEISLDAHYSLAVAVGIHPDLWSLLVRPWGLALRRERPDLVLRIEMLSTSGVLEGLITGRLDLAFLLEPASSPDLSCELIARIPLVLVATRPGLSVEEAVGDGYLHVDWGRDFTATHRRQLPGLSSPAWQLSHGTLALDLLRHAGGSAFLPEPMVLDELGRGALHRVQAPTFACSAYAAWSPQIADPALIDGALRHLRTEAQ